MHRIWTRRFLLQEPVYQDGPNPLRQLSRKRANLSSEGRNYLEKWANIEPLKASTALRSPPLYYGSFAFKTRFPAFDGSTAARRPEKWPRRAQAPNTTTEGAAASAAAEAAVVSSASPRPAAAAATSPMPPLPTPAQVHAGNIRSGEQVFARGRTLVVLGSVNSGGEAIADQDVIVLGTLRGRALAGMAGSGGNGCRIVAAKFDAELVGIGDAIATCERPSAIEGFKLGAPAVVALERGKLVFSTFDPS